MPPLPDVHLGHCGTFDLWLRDVGGVHKLHYDNGGGLVAFTDTTTPVSGAIPIGAIPIGGIVLWYGNIASIPANWALCDGSAHGGYTTPDLRDKFVVGAKQDDGGVAKTNITGSLTQSGGSINYTPAGTQGSPTISAHSFTPAGTNAPEDSHVHDIGHVHPSGQKPGTAPGNTKDGTLSGTNSGAGSSHNHAFTGSPSSLAHTVSAPGGFTGTADTIIPPYYALAYIMRYA